MFRFSSLVRLGVSAALLAAVVGCGTTKSRIATEQLLVSDAVDEAVSSIDFRALSGKTVYFDTTYVKNVKGLAFTNAEYIISSLRQQMVGADCRLQDDREEAEIVVEARVGTVGTDGNDIVYGVPASNGLSSAASLVPNAPLIPAIPEIALARKEAQFGAVKVAVFAYERSSRRPIWQSGIAKAKSTAADFWFFGAGPFQRGTIYGGTQFAGSQISLPRIVSRERDRRRAPVAYHREHTFDSLPTRLAELDEPSAAPPSEPEQEGTIVPPGGWPSPFDRQIVTPLESELKWR